ncbi:hypothetical protein ACFSVM_09640 [Paenibacillus shunpengii]|nr:hypothetical protein [Paenibacillus sp. FSL H7-0326]
MSIILILMAIVLTIEVVAIEVNMKRKMENDKLMLERLDQIIDELQRLK